MKTLTQEQQVVERMRNEGGYATLKRLNEIIDFSTWKTKTPEASVRRIVQQSKYFFKNSTNSLTSTCLLIILTKLIYLFFAYLHTLKLLFRNLKISLFL